MFPSYMFPSYLFPSYLFPSYLFPSYLFPSYLFPSYLFPSYLFPSYLFPSYLFPSYLFPSYLFPSYLFPSGLLPSGLCPSGLFPSGLFPSGLFPSGLFPSGLFPSGLFPSGLFPSGLFPSCLFPSCLFPSCLFPSCLFPSYLFPSYLFPSYLFPSGLFDNKAKPLMRHPDEEFPKQRAVQWGADRRPFHFLFYTGKQSYYSLMHDTFTKALAVEKHQDRLRGKDLFTQDAKQISLKEELEELLVETLSEHDYAQFIQLMERLLSLSYCSVEEDFVQRYCRQLEIQSSKQQVQPLQYDQHGVAYSTGDGRRKTATGTVLLRDSGSGSISINGTNYVHYFPVLQDRSVLGRFDMQCSVSGGGHSSQAGVLRHAIFRAMLSFLSEGQVETMRQAGLLTPDPRIKERKKPGQEGARRKFTWKKC
ncbi:28S ribosomal protein S9, mitochondrial-like [Oncorhynchus keta]|uniref:28S ribosomal protein S9, mitochondrial-like n=1 Tax=Oncorhynchus keta TaxID=8018 RepID=UPI00227B9721|nr:28S ribosomal protein S9, mitochondrial-like [Oncorhynchus keta]